MASEEDEIKQIRERITRAEKYWRDENEDKFKRFRRYLKIQHYPDGNVLTDRISVPYVHSIIRSKLPAIYLRNPQYKLYAKQNMDYFDPSAIKNTAASQAVMDYLPDEIGLEDEAKQCVLDAIAFGRGVAKIGFEFDYDDEKVLVDKFFVKRVANPNGAFVLDPVSNNGLTDALWCAEKIVAPLKTIQKDKSFKNTKDLKPNAKLSDDLIGKQKEDKDEEYLEYWMYWEKNAYGVVDKYACIVTDQDVVMKKGKNPYAHGDFPYEILDTYNIPDYAFPIGDIEPIETQQNELDKAESLMLSHMKKFIQKYKVRKGTLDGKARDAFESPENTVIELEDINDLTPLENPSVNQTIPLATRTIKDDLNQISGINEYTRGSAPAGDRRTALEASLIDSGSKQRSDEALHVVEKFMARVGKKLFQTVQQYMTKDMYIRIAGDGSSLEDWKKITAEDIKGDFEITVVPESTAPINKEMEKRQWLEMYNLLRKDEFVNPIWLITNVLKAYRVQDLDTAIKTPDELAQDREQQMQREMKQQQMMAQISQQGQPQETELPETEGSADEIDDGMAGRIAPANPMQGGQGFTNL